jgi:prolyl 4-hydroxylase
MITGRPYPLKGRYYANIFVHFEPSGHCMRHAERMKGEDVAIDDAKVLYERAQKRLKQNQDKMKAKKRENKGSASTGKVGGQNGQEKSRRAPSTPYYIQPGSIEKERWNQEVMYDMNLVRTFLCFFNFFHAFNFPKSIVSQ